MHYFEIMRKLISCQCSKGLVPIQWGMRVHTLKKHLDLESGPLGHDPFLSQYDPESVSKWSRNGSNSCKIRVKIAILKNFPGQTSWDPGCGSILTREFWSTGLFPYLAVIIIPVSTLGGNQRRHEITMRDSSTCQQSHEVIGKPPLRFHLLRKPSFGLARSKLIVLLISQQL